MLFFQSLIRPLRPLIPFFLFLLFTQNGMRIALLIKESSEISFSTLLVAKTFAIGFFFDSITFLYFWIPFLIYRNFVPKSNYLNKQDKIFIASYYTIFVWLIVFITIGGWFFWLDLGVRINFLTWDYLEFPKTVFLFLWETYPLPLIASFFIILFTFSFYIIWKFIIPKLPPVFISKTNYLNTTFNSCLFVFLLFFTSSQSFEIEPENHLNEISKNDLHSVLSALVHFWDKYPDNYLMVPPKKTVENLKKLLLNNNASFVDPSSEKITRIIKSDKEEKHHNVILILMESMSASYMRAFGNNKELTPNLDAIADQSLFFTNHFACGTRTVRGLEATTLLAPPSPGRSIVKDAYSDQLFTIGTPFQKRNYETTFFYNGESSFDNALSFYSGNAFNIVDYSNFSNEEISFENAFGVCDEDLFKKIIVHANALEETKKKFFFQVLTASNHPPFTFPKEQINIEGLTDKESGVKYADHSIGLFMELAKKQKWFSNTIFIFVADHSAYSSGKHPITLDKFRIPLIFYNPGLLPSQKNNALACQIDIAPTLFGLLNFNYISQYYGNDLLKPGKKRAFLANFDKLGYLTENSLTVLKPYQQYEQYDPTTYEKKKVDEQEVEEAISFYQHASYWKTYMKQ